MKSNLIINLNIKIIPLIGLVVWLSLTAFISPTGYVQTQKEKPVERGQFGDLSNPRDMEDFFETVLPHQLEENHIPGAAVSLVKDGKMIFSRGYGYANIDAGQRVDADETLFRTGSVAKLFVWTAVMQLVEQGKLDLNEDVNHYLVGFQIPATFPGAITLTHLMTHTAGFEDGPVGMIRATVNDLEPLGSFLARKSPARVNRPGEITAYSNYGAALAANIVENVSGLPFEDYVEQKILIPLQMKNTTFRQPLPPELERKLSAGYDFKNDLFLERPFEAIQIGPAGGASATVTDMAKFMNMQLSGGTLNGKQILEAKSVHKMHERHFTNDPLLTGVAYGFYETRVNGNILLTHAGDTSYFHSQMIIFPGENLGLYVVYNASGGINARHELIQDFFNRFFPAQKYSEMQPAENPISNPGLSHSGKYVSTRSTQSSLEKIRILFDPRVLPVSITGFVDGSLELFDPFEYSLNPGAYKPGHWEARQDNIFHNSDETNTLLFREDLQGDTYLFLDSNPLRGYRKLAWHEEILLSPFFPLTLAAILGLIFLVTMLNKKSIPIVRRFTVLTVVSAGLCFIGLAAFGLLGFTSYLYGSISPIWYIIFTLPVIFIGCLIGWVIILRKTNSIPNLPFALAVISAGGLIWWMQYWNLIGWRL